MYPFKRLLLSLGPRVRILAEPQEVTFVTKKGQLRLMPTVYVNLSTGAIEWVGKVEDASLFSASFAGQELEKIDVLETPLKPGGSSGETVNMLARFLKYGVLVALRTPPLISPRVSFSGSAVFGKRAMFREAAKAAEVIGAARFEENGALDVEEVFF